MKKLKKMKRLNKRKKKKKLLIRMKIKMSGYGNHKIKGRRKKK
jgi:hypothetical protein